MECFGKKRLRQRNPKNLVCLTCLGREEEAPTKAVKRECSGCGKILARDRFSKTQWAKRKLGDCQSCVERKKSTRVICQKCRKPNAYQGYTICRDCHIIEKVLPGGVRVGVPKFRDPRSMSFATNTINRDKLLGTYELIYFSIDESHQSEPTISSTVKGRILIECFSGDDRLKGIVQFDHSPFERSVPSIRSFHSVNTSNDDFFLSNKPFFSSHIHDFAPDSTWHDPRGDLYIKHGSDSPGKLKVLVSEAPLLLDVLCSEKEQRKRNKSTKILTESYKDVENYWICLHLELPEDVGRMIRTYICPPPVLHLLPGDIFLVTTIKRKEKVDWPEIILVGRKKNG